MEWTPGSLVWFDPGVGHSLPGEVIETHKAAQVIIIQALINGKVTFLYIVIYFLGNCDTLEFE